MNNYTNTEISALTQAISKIESKLAEIPHIKLRCRKCNGTILWYEKGSGPPKSRYISKSNRLYAEQLAYYTFASEYLEELKKKLKLLHLNEDSSKKLERIKQKYFLEKEGFSTLLKSNYKSINEKSLEWISEDYEKNEYKKDELIFRTLDGHMVRSKSEVMISDYLFEHGIPYRYECRLDLGSTTYYPDFMIRRISDGKIFYWEHFGLMDDAGYANSANKKIANYIANHILPSDNFITSFECHNRPFSSSDVGRLVDMYALTT